MTEIILARHGETAWNVEEIFRGRIDVELNETGLKQAELLAEYLREKEIEAVYSSPLRRALNTAQAVGDIHQLKVETVHGLIDMDFGEWQGLSVREVEERYKECYTDWINRPEKVKIPGGENLDDVRERATDVIDHLVEKHKRTVFIVSHRVVNKVLICALLGLDNSHFWNIRQDTCGIIIFIYENGRYILTRHNDTSHLKSLPTSRRTDF